MLSYALTVGGIAAATLIPDYLALYLIPSLHEVPLKYLGALGIGLTFWFFFDIMGDASQLDSNESIYPFNQFNGLSGGYSHYYVIVAFILGLVALAIFDHLAVPKPFRSSENTSNSGKGYPHSKYLVFVPIAVAAVMGIHGLGEGWAFGSLAHGSGTANIVDMFGGPGALISYPIHKFLEAAIVACVYTIYVKRSGNTAAWHVPVLGLLFGLTSVIGAANGYYITTDGTVYFFAFGVTAALYAAIRLAGPLVYGQTSESIVPTYFGPKTFLWLAVGFFLLYFAALLH